MKNLAIIATASISVTVAGFDRLARDRALQPVDDDPVIRRQAGLDHAQRPAQRAGGDVLLGDDVIGADHEHVAAALIGAERRHPGTSSAFTSVSSGTRTRAK